MSVVKVNDFDLNTNDAQTKLGKYPILGTFEGECADPDITNENGMDIGRDVFRNIFSSDIYEKALKLGWYIGFLGHPDDPGCMDFEHACIVMTEGHLDETTGKVYGKFNLIGTPVGYIVKAFIDAGVTFGISIRGAGDLNGSEVDPDTFIFRGFDLVTFPAFPDAIPEFQAIAASSDVDKQLKYKKVCAAVKTNLKDITSCETINIIQSQFAKQSPEYAELEQRKAEICSSESINLDARKLEGMTHLYLSAADTINVLASENESLKRQIRDIQVDASRKIASMKRIIGSRLTDAKSAIIGATRKTKRLQSENSSLKSQITASEKSNLIYKQKIDNQSGELRKQASVISSLQLDYDETVDAATNLETRASNLDVKNKELKSEITACQKKLNAFQKAYAQLYADALGVNLDTITITADTSVDDLKKVISGSVSMSNHSDDTLIDEDGFIDIVDDNDDLLTL